MGLALDCEDDDFEEVSDFRASIADDAAPRASNITKTPSTPRHAAPFTPVIQQAPCHNKKPNKIAAFPISPDPLEPEPHRQ